MQKTILVPIAAAIALLQACNAPTGNVSQQSFIKTENMDSSVKPSDNFFQFVNGKWLKTAVIPSTETSTGAGRDLFDRTKEHIKSILDSVSKADNAKGSIGQQVGDFYASGLDSATIEKLGYDPVKPYLAKINAFTDAKSVLAFENDIQKTNHAYIIAMYAGADLKNSGMNIDNFQQTGLGLPDRDYYFKTDPATLAVQQAYKAYIVKSFALIGVDTITGAKKADDIYNVEKQIAGSHRTNVELRDPQSNYNKWAVKDLDKKTPTISWSGFLTSLGIKADSVNIGQPAYYIKLNELLTTVPVDTWKAYYTFHVLDDAAPALSSAFVNANFDYHNKALSGQKQIKPRWERIYAATDVNLGDALGQLYVAKYFTADAKQRVLDLVNNLQKALEQRIGGLDWMSDSTKVKAKEKLNAFLKKIGFPDKWRDYSKVTIDKGKYFDNLMACAENEFAYQTAKIGQPVDRTEWGMTAPTINAYYNPTNNEIVFPSGILQFPFFDPAADDAINYGGIGMVIGHEMTHGFDDEGAQFDKDGNLKNWWSKEDYAKFQAKAKQVSRLYSTFTVLDTLHVNGDLTTGENMADVGGVAIAYTAFKMTKEGQDTTKIDGFTPDQRFFISIGQISRNKMKEEAQRLRIFGDPHSPSMYRVNGPLMNFTPFYQAFNVQPGDKMYVADSARIKIW